MQLVVFVVVVKDEQRMVVALSRFGLGNATLDFDSIYLLLVVGHLEDRILARF